MLQKLGRRLTLLNMVISGAILLAIAIIALGIAEETISTQHENDLTMYTRSMFSMAFRTVNGNTEYIIQTPQRYMVVLESASGDMYISAEHPLGEELAKDIAAIARQKLAERKEQADLSIGGQGEGGVAISTADSTHSSQRLVGGVTSGAIRQTVQGSSIGAPSFIMNTNPFFVTGANNTQYRVSAMQIQADANGALILVMQDRTDELGAIYRLRWLFVSYVVGGLVLIFIASLYLSRRAIQPIDRSIRQQRAFVAAASHELRTPLAALSANAEILKDAPLGEYSPYLDSVLHVSSRMTLLVSDLMDLARADAGELNVHMMPVDANEVAAKAVQWMRPLAEQRSIEIQRGFATSRNDRRFRPSAPGIAGASRQRGTLYAAGWPYFRIVSARRTVREHMCCRYWRRDCR